MIIKWLIQEKDTDYALAFREKHITGESIIAVPDLLFYEIANVLVTKTSLERSTAQSGLRNVMSLDLEMYHLGLKSFIAAMEISDRYKITFYDSAYIILAKKLGCNLITADMHLWTKVKDLGFIHLLGK